MNQNIAQTETSLQQKQTEQTQNPQNNILPTEINQLEQQLTTYKTQKAKLETILPKLEQQISNLSQGNNSEPGQEQVIQQLEQEIKEINQELGIKEEPNEKKPDNPEPQKTPPTPQKKDNKDKEDNPSPIPDKKPNKNPNSPDNSQNISTFQTLQSQVQELTSQVDKINQKYEEKVNNWKLKDEPSRNLADKMTNGKLQTFVDSLQSIDISNLTQWISTNDYQIFLTLDSETQKTNISLVKDIIKSTLDEIKRSLESTCGYFKKFVEMFKMMQTETGRSVIDCQDKLNNLSQQNIAQQIKTIQQVWPEIERWDWGN